MLKIIKHCGTLLRNHSKAKALKLILCSLSMYYLEFTKFLRESSKDIKDLILLTHVLVSTMMRAFSLLHGIFRYCFAKVSMIRNFPAFYFHNDNGSTAISSHSGAN